MRAYADQLPRAKPGANGHPHTVFFGPRGSSAAHPPSASTANVEGSGTRPAAADAGLDIAVFSRGPRTLAKGTWDFADQLADLGDFLRALPKPAGLFAFDAAHAWRGAVACHDAGLRVPDDVALICGGDDESVFEAMRPTITGMRYDSLRVGYR